MNHTAILTELFQAAESGDVSKVKDMLKADPTLVHEHNEDGLTLLGWTAHFGHKDIVQIILDYGGEVNALSKPKVQYIPANTALHAAIAGKRNIEVIKLLLDHDAATDILDSNGHTCLHTAAFHDDNVDIAELLIKWGADVHAQDQTGKTPLMLAMEQGNDKVVQALHKHGATE
jgi:uncharacterized protein